MIDAAVSTVVAESERQNAELIVLVKELMQQIKEMHMLVTELHAQ